MNNLHDAEIIGLSVERRIQYARLDFRLDDGASRSVELKGLRAFRCEDLTIQNVVSRLIVSDQANISREDMTYWIDWVTSFSDTGSWLNGQHKVEWLTACENGTLKLVLVEPSAGAQIAAVCECFALVD